ELHRQRDRVQRRDRQQPALRRGPRHRSHRHHGGVPVPGEATRRVRGPVMEPRAVRIALRVWAGLVMAFLYVPVALISLYAFNLSLWTIVVGHATFCIVIVYNNVLARLRRTSGSVIEASMDLGARGWQTMRFVTLPLLRTALVAGALLAFALSFDEVVVTLFTAGAQNTLPLWIYGAIREGQHQPEVNVVVFFVILVTVLPVTIAARIAGTGGISRAAGGRSQAERGAT